MTQVTERSPEAVDELGSLEFFEIGELDDSEIGQLRAYEGALAMLLGEQDVQAVAEAVEPGSTAALLVWENSWAAPFTSAVRRAGGPASRPARLTVPRR